MPVFNKTFCLPVSRLRSSELLAGLLAVLLRTESAISESAKPNSKFLVDKQFLIFLQDTGLKKRKTVEKKLVGN